MSWPLYQHVALKQDLPEHGLKKGDVATLVDTWLPLSNALNSLNRTMGQPDVYPFILSPAVIKKLGAIHDLIHGEGIAVTP